MKNKFYLHYLMLAFLLIGFASCEKEYAEPENQFQTKKRQVVVQDHDPCDDGPVIPGQLQGTPICTGNFIWSVVGNWEVNVGVDAHCSDLTLIMYHVNGTPVFEFDLYDLYGNFIQINPSLLQEFICGGHYIVVVDECEVYEESPVFSLGNC